MYRIKDLPNKRPPTREEMSSAARLKSLNDQLSIYRDCVEALTVKNDLLELRIEDLIYGSDEVKATNSNLIRRLSNKQHELSCTRAVVVIKQKKIKSLEEELRRLC